MNQLFPDVVQPRSGLDSLWFLVTMGFTAWLFTLKPVGLDLRYAALPFLGFAQWLFLHHVWPEIAKRLNVISHV